MDWHPNDTANETGYAHAEEYFRRNGTLSMPERYISEDGYPLGAWLAKKRTCYKKGKLSEAEIKRLEKLNFATNPLDERKRKLWEKGYAHAEEFFNEYGHLRVGEQKSPDGYGLGTWVVAQRKAYRDSKLPEEYVQKLNKINMVWDADTFRWEEGFVHAKQYVEEHGDCRVPVNYVCQDGFYLGTWILKNRRRYSNNELTEEQVARLNSLQMIWDSWDDYWEEGFAHAKVFFNANGHLNVPYKYKAADGYKLGQFITNQKRSFNLGQLTEEKIKRLNDIGMIWDVRANMWATAYKHAKDYFEKHGTLEKMPKGYLTEDGINLYVWLSLQRKQYRIGKLSADRVALLKTLNIGLEPRNHEDIWEDSFTHAEAYFIEHGDLLVPCFYRTKDDRPLGNWILRQRKLYRDGLLTEDQIERLNRIGMVWKIRTRKNLG
jgi:uncharacterized protein (DUF2384 family)